MSRATSNHDSQSEMSDDKHDVVHCQITSSGYVKNPANEEIVGTLDLEKSTLHLCVGGQVSPPDEGSRHDGVVKVWGRVVGYVYAWPRRRGEIFQADLEGVAPVVESQLTEAPRPSSTTPHSTDSSTSCEHRRVPVRVQAQRGRIQCAGCQQ